MKITSVTLNFFGSRPSGSVGINFEGGYSHHNLSNEALEKIQAICFDCIMAEKAKMKAAIDAIQPPPQIGYDETKTIEGEKTELDLDDNIPF